MYGAGMNYVIVLKRYSEVTSQAIGPFSESVATERAQEIRKTKEFVRVRILPLSQDIHEPAHH